MSVTKALPQTPVMHRMANPLGFLFGIMGTGLTTANALTICQIETQNAATLRELHTLTHIAKIQEKHLEQKDLKIMANKKLKLEGLRCNLAMLASTANTLVFQTTD